MMPYLHLPFHETAEPTESYSPCCAHTAVPDTGPEESESHHDEQEDCSLCELMLLPADLPQILCSSDAAPILIRGIPPSSEPAAVNLPKSHQARAPPFMTV